MSVKNVTQMAKATDMDYKQTGTPKLVSKNAPHHNEHNAKGTDKNPYGNRETKADLLERMKAAAQAGKKS
ncbi:MAG: hypothetical protein ACPGRD_05265 [Planktomarina sp.]